MKSAPTRYFMLIQFYGTRAYVKCQNHFCTCFSSGFSIIQLYFQMASYKFDVRKQCLITYIIEQRKKLSNIFSAFLGKPLKYLSNLCLSFNSLHIHNMSISISDALRIIFQIKNLFWR